MLSKIAPIVRSLDATWLCAAVSRADASTHAPDRSAIKFAIYETAAKTSADRFTTR
jgi:hypothetical protein